MVFHLTSTATAIAILPSQHLHGSINKVRSIHDKAYHRWPPHINLLYPFVHPSRLSEAVQLIRQFLSTPTITDINVTVTNFDSFRHRKNATVFLKPVEESGNALRVLRKGLVEALGCEEHEGTHDGEYKPHLTVGQAALNDSAINKLTEKAANLTELEWLCTSLIVLKREPSGEMTVVDELSLGGKERTPTSSPKAPARNSGWKTCHSFTPECGWTRSFWHKQPAPPAEANPPSNLNISSYNVMTAPYAPSLELRFPLIMKSISSLPLLTSSLNVLCLQEVSQEMLPLLLSDPFIQTSYPYSTHHQSTRLLNQRNLVILASAPFTHYTLEFEEHHKSSLIADFANYSFKVANVHLTSALTDKAVIAKKNQMTLLTKFLLTDAGENDIFVAGDFNLTTSTKTVETALSRRLVAFKTARSLQSIIDRKIWADAFELLNNGLSHNTTRDIIEGEEGATFDRMTNRLAAMSEGLIDNRPQRYDRILFQKGGQVHVESFEIFGYPAGDGACASDHYGISATVNLRHAEAPEVKIPASNTAFEVSNVTPDSIDIMEDDTDVQSLIAPHLPSEFDRLRCEEALDLLRIALGGSETPQKVILQPLGSYAMDTNLSTSDIDVLVIGSISVNDFFATAPFRLEGLTAVRNTDANIITDLNVINALVPIIELTIFDIKFDLQYCQAEDLIQRYHALSPSSSISSLVSSRALLSTLNPSSLLAINSYRDMSHLRQTIPCFHAYQSAHRYLALFLKRRGLYSARFGYLGGIQLSLMLNRVVKLMSLSRTPSADLGTAGVELTAASIIRTFFTHYSKTSSYDSPILDPDLPPPSTAHGNVGRVGKAPQALIIPPLFTPAIRSNTAYASTPLSVSTLRAEFSLATSELAGSEGIEGWEWLLRPRSESILGFFSAWKAFVRVRVDIWNNPTNSDNARGNEGDTAMRMAERARKVISALESRIPSLMLALGRIHGVDARVWPGRFVDLDERQNLSEVDDAGVSSPDELGGWYFIGVSALAGTEDPTKKAIEGRVLDAAKAFEGTLRALDEFTTGNAGAWVDVDVVSRKTAAKMNAQLDERKLGVLFPHRIPNRPEESQPSEISLSSRPSQRSAASTPKLSKLPPAQDVISRIRWDPLISPSEFVIGYSDRFAGVQEVPLLKWKMESTDLEFIPMHRVMWMRRKGEDGEKVWDRVARRMTLGV